MVEQSQSKGHGLATIIAALIVSAGIAFAASPYGLGGAKTVTVTATTTTTTSTTPPTSIVLHKVTFNESGACGGVYASKWAITIGNITITQPWNATLPISYGIGSVFEASGTFKMISQIVFTLPDGGYRYDISGGLSTSDGLSNGTVLVNGSDAIVPVEGPYISCVG